jgi:dTDP-4-amino-4,6-dideoxygalactose transaminase
MESIKGLNPPKQLADIDHSWWIFCFTIDEEILDVSLDDFAKAISAEGMPFSKGYIPNPVFEYPVVADQLTFGTSGWPYTTDAARQNISHDRKDYPGTIWALGHWFITNWNEGYTDADVDDIVEGLTKVAASFAR